ncbi:MAG: hypothetical protein IT521_14820 [Burkholderiales bacterium]|nr:hypothetical protein [Burkholderiales bacterium]
MSTVIFLSGKSGNDALGAAGRAHRRLYEDLGHEFVEVNFGDPASQELFNRTISKGSIEFAFATMGMGADLKAATPDGREVNLWEAAQIPYLSLNGDSPAYYFDRHVSTSPWHACLYYYPEHLELRKRFDPKAGLHGIVPPMPFDMVDRSEVDFDRKAQGKLLFMKNGNDPAKLVASWREAMPADTFIMLVDLAGELAADLDGPAGSDIDAIVTASFLGRGWDISEFARLRLFFIAQLDDYLRRVKSTMVADAIADFPVQIQGMNWEHMDFSGRRATYIKGGDYSASRQQIIDSLGLIDMSPNTQRAPHDRPMRAFGLWTLCLTNRQSFFEQNFSRASEFTYRFDKGNLQELITAVLAHPKRYMELGQDVAEQFRKGRRPEAFAEYMVATAGHVRLACGPRLPGLQDYFGWPPATLG